MKKLLLLFAVLTTAISASAENYILMVPKEARLAYRAAAYWCQFYNIVGLTDEEIAEITPVASPTANTSSSAKEYNLGGTQVNVGYRGIVIKDGKKYLKK